jgi:uncharacterized protein YggE
MRKLAVPLVLFLAAGAAGAAAASAETVTVLGLADVKVVPGNPENNASIKAAVERAHAAGVPLALADAREEAAELAGLSGLTLGDIESISEAASPYGPGYGYGGYSPFGRDQYCGTQTRRRRVRGSDGRLRTKRVKVRRCYVPRRLSTTLEVTFKASRAG